MFFLNLATPSKSKGVVNKANKIVFLDECMPTEEQKRNKKGWLDREEENFTTKLHAGVGQTIWRKFRPRRS